MLTRPEQIKFVAEVAGFIHADRLRDAALRVSDFSSLNLKIDSDNPKDCMPPLQFLLHYLLNNHAPEAAASLCWTPNLFSSEPQSTQEIWKLFDDASLAMIMGSASMSKSFSMGVRLMLEWVRDPAYTTIKLIGPSEDHLTANLFSHLVSLHSQSKIPLPGEIGELFIGLDRRNRLSSISGVVIPVGNVRKSGRLQGVKRKPRPSSHPIFGALSRLFIFVDEIESVPSGLFSDVDNIVSNTGEGSDGGFKLLAAFNPQNQHGEVGKRCEPEFGWNDFDPDKHFRWKSKRGWEVLRLDAEKSENVIAGKTIFTGLQTKQGLEQIARNAGGRTAPGYWTMGRGAFPPAGLEMTMVPQGMIGKCRGEFIWYEPPQAVGSCDLALEGNAAAIFSKGLYGLATGIKYPPNLEFPAGRTVMFKDPKGQSLPKPGLMLESQMVLPKGDTVKMKDAIIGVCRKSGIRPEYFAIDRTGNGAGVCDLIRHEWSTSIVDVNFSQSASETKIMAEDNKTAKEEYDRLSSELWGALAKWSDFGVLMIHPQVSMEHLSQELTQRRYRNIGGRVKVESKADFFSRGHPSPDHADSLTLLIHAVRRGFSVIPSMTGVADLGVSEDDWGYPGANHRIDESNRTEILNLDIV
jgi:hypothetical protein